MGDAHLPADVRVAGRAGGVELVEDAMRPAQIISGAQTGADIGALRAAAALSIATGGYCPRNCKTELGDRPWLINRYGLTETSSSAYGPRTSLNIQTADVTVLYGEMTSPGSKLALRTIDQLRKPYLVNPTVEELRTLTGIVNIAGNRESGNRGIEAAVFALVVAAWPREDGRVVAAPWPAVDPKGMGGLRP